jgi:hypothetical protein
MKSDYFMWFVCFGRSVVVNSRLSCALLFTAYFICSLFNDTSSVAQTIKRRLKGWYVNDELERMRNEASWLNLIYYPAVYLEGLRNTTKNLNQDSRYSGRDLNQGLSEYEVGLLPIRPRRSVSQCSSCWLSQCRHIWSFRLQGLGSVARRLWPHFRSQSDKTPSVWSLVMQTAATIDVLFLGY